jgi:hypothetical protein
MQQRKQRGSEILIAVASTIFGLLVGPILEKITMPLFDIPTRATLASILLLSVMTIISITMVGILIRRSDTDMVKLSGDILNVRQRLGLTVRFIHDIPSKSQGEAYRIERQIIESAQKEILILHYSRPRSSSERIQKENLETEAYKKERNRTMQTVIQKLQQHKDDKFFYRRVIQLPDSITTKLDRERLGTHWTKHLNDILDLQKNLASEAACIKKSPLFFELTFVMVDEQYVILRPSGTDPDQGVRYAEGAFVFDDPYHELTPYLKGIFLKIDAHGLIVRTLPEV